MHTKRVRKLSRASYPIGSPESSRVSTAFLSFLEKQLSALHVPTDVSERQLDEQDVVRIEHSIVLFHGSPRSTQRCPRQHMPRSACCSRLVKPLLHSWNLHCVLKGAIRLLRPKCAASQSSFGSLVFYGPSEGSRTALYTICTETICPACTYSRLGHHDVSAHEGDVESVDESAWIEHNDCDDH